MPTSGEKGEILSRTYHAGGRVVNYAARFLVMNVLDDSDVAALSCLKDMMFAATALTSCCRSRSGRLSSAI